MTAQESIVTERRISKQQPTFESRDEAAAEWCTANGIERFNWMSGCDWLEVSDRELQDVWRNLAVVYDGCTHDELCRVHGADNIKHVRGEGWYRRTPAAIDKATRCAPLALPCRSLV